jgi:hypoxanthine phosphoribosyltransferase
MKKIRVKDRDFEVFIPAEKINAAVSAIAQKINRDLRGQKPLFLVILNGAFMFAADLFKKLDMACEISFVKLASYSGTRTSSDVKELIGLNTNLKGRQVIIIEDIIDTGITMEYLVRKLNALGVADLRIASLFFKPDAFKRDFTIDYIGLNIPNDFIVGYGLDYDGFGRNYKEIYKLVD